MLNPYPDLNWPEPKNRFYLIIVLICLIAGSGYAQTIKTGVLVIGGSASGIAAAIQASRSGAKTILIEETGSLGANITAAGKAYDTGIWAEILNKAGKFQNDKPGSPDAATLVKVLKGLTDTVKNLTVRYNSGWQKIEKSGKGWQVKLAGGKTTIKAEVTVDATDKCNAAAAANVPFDQKTKSYQTIASAGPAKFYDNKLYRTSAGIGKDLKSGEPYFIPLGALVAFGQENFLITGKIAAGQLPSDAMFTGQAAGAAAAYCAFFKTTTKSLSARVVQGELLGYKSWLIPFTDIEPKDPDFIILQHIGITGILKGRSSGKEFLFAPDSTVSSEEIRAVMKEFYSRSQIWFADNRNEKLTLDQVLSLIRYTGSRGQELNREVESGWKGSFGFKSTFDLKRIITRREFAVLIETYLKPSNVRVDLNGNLGS